MSEAPVVRIAYLGSAGSFSEQAAELHASQLGEACTLRGARAPDAVLALLAGGLVERAVLPIANSRGGLVRPVLDALAASACESVAELVLPVRFALWARNGEVTLAALERVASHPQAFAQCARFLARELAGRAQVEYSDTASAARDLADGVLAANVAVLASARAGERHGLALLRADVQDDPDNRTFFVVLRRRSAATAVD